MSTILAFAGSNSSSSINYKLVQYTAGLVGEKEVQVVNLANYPFPLYSVDEEKNNGFINSLIEFNSEIKSAAGLIISVNEHNSNPSAYFKNLLDWLSRVDKAFLAETDIFLMSTSPGKRGGMSALEITANLLPRFGATVVATFSLPSFQENFDEAKGIVDADLAKQHQEALNQFLAKLS
ncbi:NADPH-dependent FMN reductase [Cellulophaga baltica]|uniref:NADPH-dependent FMN reductase n=1 Tax=Cellulophaga baltica TaxID=76594 RepID=UPI00042A209F|nr:NAD(P)H-dependent oxidoreductase [Cellulophaga baltica]AIY14361.1 NADPH-dependent FMN reductase [Cellulophaga baltica NN016038]